MEKKKKRYYKTLDPPSKASLEILRLQILELLALSGSSVIKSHEKVALNQSIPQNRSVGYITHLVLWHCVQFSALSFL